ncbi:MAG: hypothetical protein EAZ57_06340 [Cytophagales bacterium]|nr:MAG: hypothetical protein EAZ67_07485 [Cytophagales bacterium]TAF60644.1 MAG: hypothetical protein EAZ57_06340 [Cytophagales bacterium]
MYIFTMGLPNGMNTKQKYRFQIEDRHIFLEGNYVGRDQVGEPLFPEQAAWLNSLASTVQIKEVWYGVWECSSEAELEKVIQLLQPFVA